MCKTGKHWPLAILFIFLTLAFVTTSVKAQKTISVPGDAASIQAGINAASNGDTVLVAPGLYVENVNFNGKNITVTSSGSAAATVIDGNQNGVVVTFASGEGRQSVINGFTIQNGALPPNPATDQTSDGILVSAANPTITNNIITQNRGYGIEIDDGSAYISGNIISYTSTRYNPAQDYGCDYDDGDGIFLSGKSSSITSAPVIDHNTIEYNVGHCEGGGIGMNAASPSTTISNNIIANNQSLGQGGGISVGNAVQVSIFQNLIYDNVAGESGGGIYLDIGSGSGPVNLWITNNTIAGNSISLNPLLTYGGGYLNGSQVVFTGYVSQTAFFNDIIVAGDSFSAIACWPTYQSASWGPPVAVDSDILNTGGPALGGWCTSTSGFGNISADPKFNDITNGDYHLQSGSPAIDSGYNAALGLLTLDLDGNPRIQNATRISQAIVDMGAYEAAGSSNLRSASQTTITAQPLSVNYGKAVNLSSAVTDSSLSPIPTGTVSFLDDWTPIGQATVNDSGIASSSTSGLAVGTHWLLASYEGNSEFDESVSSAAEVVVNGFSTTMTLTFSANPASQPLTMTATVSSPAGYAAGAGSPTGSIVFSVGNVIAIVPLNVNGTASFTTASLPVGESLATAIYNPTGGFLGSYSGAIPVQILNAPTLPKPTVNVTLSQSSVMFTQPLTVTVEVTGTNNNNPTPTGVVIMEVNGSGVLLSSPLINGSATFIYPPETLWIGTFSLSAFYQGDVNYSGAIASAIYTVTSPPVNPVPAPVIPSFTVSGTTVTISPGATTGNTSTITLTPTEGFTGYVTLTAAITSSPNDAQYPPTFSFGSTTPVGITSANPVTAILTIATTPATSSALDNPPRPGIPWFASGATLACILLFCIPARCRSWRTLLGMLVLLVSFVGGVLACASITNGGSSGGGGGGVKNPGTTAGTYTITVTGASDATTVTNTVNLTVQ